MVAKKLGVSTATLFQRAGSKEQLMRMALQPEMAVLHGLGRGVQPGLPVREQLAPVLAEINEYLGTIILGSMTLRAARIESDLPEPTPYTLRRELAHWLAQAAAAGLLPPHDTDTAADVLIGALEARHIHGYMRRQHASTKEHCAYIDAMLELVFP